MLEIEIVQVNTFLCLLFIIELKVSIIIRLSAKAVIFNLIKIKILCRNLQQIHIRKTAKQRKRMFG